MLFATGIGVVGDSQVARKLARVPYFESLQVDGTFRDTSIPPYECLLSLYITSTQVTQVILDLQ